MKNNSKKYLDKIIGIIDKPYFREMGYYGIDDKKDQVYILKKVYGFDIIIYKNRNTYNTRGEWEKHEYDKNGYQISYVTSDGFWKKWERDENGSCIY